MSGRGESTVLRWLRLLGFGRNPLRRRVDRLESVMLLGAMFVALLAIPAALVLGSTIHDQSERTASEQRSVLRRVEARTLEETASAVPSTPGQVVARARVGWLDASGAQREAPTDVLIGTKVGTALTIWLDSSGAIVRAPSKPGDSTALGAAAGSTLVMLIWPSLCGLVWLGRRSLDRRRAEDWEREWERVSPRWTKH